MFSNDESVKRQITDSISESLTDLISESFTDSDLESVTIFGNRISSVKEIFTAVFYIYFLYIYTFFYILFQNILL